MRKSKQLTEQDRIEIYAMNQAGKQQNRSAAARGISSAGICLFTPTDAADNMQYNSLSFNDLE